MSTPNNFAYCADERNDKHFTISGLRADLGNIIILRNGELYANGQTIGCIDGFVITLFESAFPARQSVTVNATDGNSYSVTPNYSATLSDTDDADFTFVFALKIGKCVADYLQAVGYDVKLFWFDGLNEICNASDNWLSDLFVSIHCNAGGGSGSETYHFYGSANGRKLANCIQRQIVNSLPVVNRNVKEAGFLVLSNIACLAVLVETAFIDNPNDARLLVECEDDFARAIARGISDYYA